MDDNKPEHSSNPTDISNLQKISMKNFAPKTQLPKPSLLNFLAKFLIERTYLKNNFTFVRLKFFRLHYKTYKFLNK